MLAKLTYSGNQSTHLVSFRYPCSPIRCRCSCQYFPSPCYTDHRASVEEQVPCALDAISRSQWQEDQTRPGLPNKCCTWPTARQTESEKTVTGHSVSVSGTK